MALLPAHSLVVAAVYLGAVLLLGWWEQPDGDFSVYGLAPQACYLLLLVLLARLVARSTWLMVPAETLFALLLEWDACCMLVSAVTVHLLAVWWPAGDPDGIVRAFLALQWLGWWRLMHVLLHRSRWRGLFAAAGGALVLCATLYAQAQFGPLWYGPEAEEGDADPWQAYRGINVENVYYRQPALLDAALDRVPAGTPGRPQVYFLGFAGWAHQDVFWKEMQFVDRLMDKRYGSGQRHLLLVNHLDTLDRWPLANRNNLALALRGLGARMGPDDVLLLFLSSHGEENEGVATRFWPLSPNDIRPQQLRQMLDEAGIRWRILVVSACFSGQFVEPLKDDHTIIATASAADRSSFGCSNEDDMTYYGRALFADGLARGESLSEALQRVATRIAKREKREGKEPSQPQLWMGDAMREKLSRLERAGKD